MAKYEIPRLTNLEDFRNCQTPEEFLVALGQPTWLLFKGRNNEKCRIITTLLHGNEPSGTIAILRLIQEGFEPEADTWVLIASVQTALTKPIFSHRMLKGKADLNRCFSKNRNKEDTDVHEFANAIIEDIEEFEPCAVADVHNTSGSGPGFCVVPSDSRYIEHLESFANLFTRTLVLTDIHLGAIMEHDFGGPILTVECGGNNAPESHDLAYQGFKKFLNLPTIQDMPKANKFTTYRHPFRLEIKEGYYLNYASEYQLGSDLTLRHEIEALNFGTTPTNQNLGWLGPEGLNGLQVLNDQGEDLIHDYFHVIDDELHPKNPLHLFMVTKNLEIAVSDCLFYFCEE